MKRFYATIAGLVAMGGLFAAHLAMADRGGGYTGVLLILDHVFSIALVLGVFAIAAGVGARVLAAGGLTMDGPLEALLFRTAVGLAVLATAILGVGAFFGMRPVVLWALLGGAAVLVRREIGEVPPLVTGTLACLRARADRLSLFILLLVAVFLITGALAPPTDWDVLMYHLRVPKQFLQAGAIYRPEDNAHFAFVGLPHMLYLPLLALGTPEGPALVSALCTLGLALAGFAFGLRFLDDRTAGFSLAILWGSGMLLLVGISARTDTILGFYLFLVHYAVIRATQAEEPRFLYLAAALGGMAIGVKYNALIYLLALAPLGLWVVLTRLPQRAAALALMLGVAFVSALPWLLKNAVLLGDPVYPYLSGPRLDPWLARIYGGAAVPPHVDPSAVWHTQLPFNVVDLFAAPARITVEGEGGAYRPNLLLLVLPLCLLFLKDKVLGWLAGPALAYVVLVVWLQPTTSLRYLIPAVAPLTLVALCCYGRVWDRLLSPSRVRALLSATAVLVLARPARIVYGGLTAGRQLAYAVGAVSRRAFLQARTGEYVDVVSFVNGQLPRTSRVLMLFEARGYYFGVPVLQDNAIMSWPLLSSKLAALDCLRSAGITHVLVNRGAIAYYASRGLDLAPLRLEALDQFARECLTPIHATGGYTLFAVRGAAETGPARAR